MISSRGIGYNFGKTNSKFCAGQILYKLVSLAIGGAAYLSYASWCCKLGNT